MRLRQICQWLWLGFVIGAATIGCVTAPPVTYVDHTPEAIAANERAANDIEAAHNATTQASAANATALGLNNSAAGKVTAADKAITANPPEIPAAHAQLVSAGDDLAKQNALLLANNDRLTTANNSLASANASLASANATLTAQVTANAGLQTAAVASEARATKAEKYINDHKNDWLGPKFWRVWTAFKWTFLIGSGVLIVLLILGKIYGIDQITKPTLSFFGNVWNAFLRAIHGVGHWGLVTLLPGIGHWLVNFIDGHKELKATVAAMPVAASIAQVITATPAPGVK